METSLSFTTLICHTSTRLLIQETVLPALHSSRGVFNVFDRRLPATVIAGGFLSLGNKLAKNGRLEMDSEHMNNPNIALIFVSFFSSWPWCQKRKPSWRKRLPSWSRVPQKWQSKIILPVRKWIYKRSVYHWLFSIVCFWIRVASQQGPERTCDGSASIPPWPPKLLTHGDIYIYRIAWAYWNPQKCDINTSGKIGLLVWDSQSRQTQCQFTGFLRFVPKP